MKKLYCENCGYIFDDCNRPHFEDRLGSIFCDEKCYKESLSYREVEE